MSMTWLYTGWLIRNGAMSISLYSPLGIMIPITRSLPVLELEGQPVIQFVLTSADPDYCVAAGTVHLKPIADPFYSCINSFCIKIHNVLLYSKRAINLSNIRCSMRLPFRSSRLGCPVCPPHRAYIASRAYSACNTTVNYKFITAGRVNTRRLS